MQIRNVLLLLATPVFGLVLSMHAGTAEALVLDQAAACRQLNDGRFVTDENPFRCEVSGNFALGRGDTLQVLGGIVLTWRSGTFTNNGTIFVSNNAGIHLDGGAMNNHGDLDLDNDGTLAIDNGGYLNNFGLIQSEGSIDIARSSQGIYSSGTIRNYSGGIITNDGRLVFYERGVLNNENGGTVHNRGELYISRDSILINEDTVENQVGALVHNEGEIRNDHGMLLNAGWLENAAGVIRNDGGTIDNFGMSGFIQNWSGAGRTGQIENTSGMIFNRRGGVIDNGYGSIIENKNNGTIENNNNSTIQNAGTLSNNSGGNIDNFPFGMIGNSGLIENAAATFHNHSNAVIDNTGTIYTWCFNAVFINDGQITGNPANSCTLPPFPFSLPCQSGESNARIQQRA